MPQNCDGLYRYRWSENGSPHSTFFDVVDGLIQSNPKHDKVTPVGKFNGKPIREFLNARLEPDWPHKRDRCLQITLTKKEA